MRDWQPYDPMPDDEYLVDEALQSRLIGLDLQRDPLIVRTE